MFRAPQSVQIGLNLPFLQISGTWQPNDDEREAAWELYVELITRVAVVPLGPEQGLLSEALASFYSLFATTRDILRKHGPSIAEPKPRGQYNFGYLAVAMLNLVIRPLLAHWHPVLDDWETSRPPGQSRLEHEAAWPRNSELRTEFERTRAALLEYANLLAAACGVPDLSAAIPRPSQPPTES
jgi:hypothetical protein